MAFILLTGLSLASQATAQGVYSIAPTATPSGRHSDFIDPSFAGFGIEPSNLFSFTGYDRPNELTFNLIGNLANYTGKPPHIRLGGNTQDYMVFSDDQREWTWVLNDNAIGHGNLATDHMLIGPRFIEVMNRFPRTTPVTWGLNMAYTEPDYLDRIVQMAQQVVDGIENFNLVSFEIGNEPDLYSGNTFRSGTWGGREYVQEWLVRAQAVYDRVLQPLNITPNFFEPGATASTIGTSFQINDMQELGILATANTTDGVNSTFISSWNQHDYYYFIGVTPEPLLLEELMTLQTTEVQFKAWEEQIDQAHSTVYPYALREMCSAGPVGIANVTNTFGAALWTLNFFLYAATLNITTVQMHMTDNSEASPWHPLDLGDGRVPHVRPSYYGYAAFAQIIGPSCTTQISTLELGSAPVGYDGKVKGYSVYQAGRLSTIVLINGRMANMTEENKAFLNVTIQLPTNLAGQDLHLSFLSAAGADATRDTYWNGISYERTSNGVQEIVDPQDRTVRIGADGVAAVRVRDSEALALKIGSRIGGGVPDRTACAAIAARSQVVGPEGVTSGVGRGTSDERGRPAPDVTTENPTTTAFPLPGSPTETGAAALLARSVQWSLFAVALLVGALAML